MTLRPNPTDSMVPPSISTPMKESKATMATTEKKTQAGVIDATVEEE
jgi:hypothetical protein